MAPVCSILELAHIDTGSRPEWRTIYCFVLRVNLQLRPKAPDVYHVTDFTCNSQIAAGRPAVMVHDTPIDDDQVFTLDVFRAKTTKICDAYHARTGMPLGLTHMITAQRLSTHISDRMLVLKADVSPKLFNGVLECRTGTIDVVAQDDPSPHLEKLYYNMCRYLPSDFFRKQPSLSEMIVPERCWHDMYTDLPKSQVEKFADLQRAAQGQEARDRKAHAPPLYPDLEHRGDLVSSPILESEDNADSRPRITRNGHSADDQSAQGHISKRLRSTTHQSTSPDSDPDKNQGPVGNTLPPPSEAGSAIHNERQSRNYTTTQIGGHEPSLVLAGLDCYSPTNDLDPRTEKRASPYLLAEQSTRELHGHAETQGVARNSHLVFTESNTARPPTPMQSSSRKLWTISELAALAASASAERIFRVRARLAGSVPPNWSFVCPKLYEFSPITHAYVLTDPRPRSLELILVDEHAQGPLLGQAQYLAVHIAKSDLLLFFEMTSIEDFYVASGSLERYFLALLARAEPFTIDIMRRSLSEKGMQPLRVWLPYNCTVKKLLSS